MSVTTAMGYEIAKAARAGMGEPVESMGGVPCLTAQAVYPPTGWSYPSTVLITSDGGLVTTEWCQCGGKADPVYYEQWNTISGPTRHGWGCPACRGIVQTG